MFGLKARDKQILCLWSPSLLFIFMLIVYVSKPCHEPIPGSDQVVAGSNTGKSSCASQKRFLDQNDSTLVDYVRKYHLTPPSTSQYKLSARMTGVATEAQRNITAYLKKVLNEKHNGFFIESVALDGELFSQTLRLERDYSWDGLLIEPMPSLFKILKKRQRKAWIADVCLSGEVPKYVDVDKLKHYQSRYVEVKAYYHKEIVNQNGVVQCFPLFSLISAIKVSDNVVDLLNLNAGGAEFEILKAIPFDILKIKIIILKPFGRPKHRGSITGLLKSKGYQVDRALAAGSYMAFVRRDTNPVFNNSNSESD